MDLKHILKLNLELEADIRLHIMRDNDETKQILLEKFEELSAAVNTYFGIETTSKSEPQPEDYEPANKESEGNKTEDHESEVGPDIVTEIETDDETEQTDDDAYDVVNTIVTDSAIINDDTVKAESRPPVVETTGNTQPNNLMKSFTINDKFRFMRGIFDNDKEEFESTIAYIDTLSSLDQVYDYLLNELGWDIDNEDVADFISVVSNHFNTL